jgi:glucosamine-6-phosphate deaminase
MRVIRSADRRTIDDALFEALRSALRSNPSSLIGFATGDTYAGLFERIAEWAQHGGGEALRALRATHLDEYLGFEASRPGGMLHELSTRCPPLGEALAAGRFLPVPSDGRTAGLAAHERRIEALGGIALQFLGLGRNGHIAFNEPGTPFDLGFHRTALEPETVVDALSRFEPDEPPTQAVTAGPASILAARRLVVAATGESKAAAVRDMLEGPIGPACPASVLCRHADCVLFVDEAAASLLEGTRPSR